MNFLRKIYMKLLLPVYRYIDAENGKIRLELEKTNVAIYDIKGSVKDLRKDIESIQGSIQYFSDLMAEKSYLIECHSDEIKRLNYELKKLNIRMNNLLNTDSSKPCKIVQVVPVFHKGDAIGNYALYIDKLFQLAGLESEIYSYQNLSNFNYIKKVDDLEADAKDIVILHMASENEFAEIMDAYQSKKVLFYHNITPSKFFHGFDDFAEQSTQRGRLQVEKLASKIDYCIVDSNYNKQDLRQMGYQMSITVIPIPFEINKLTSRINEKLDKTLNDGKINLIFVGRIVPNKKIEDVIRCYQVYKDRYNVQVRLILVGNYDPKGKYYQFLQGHIREEDDILLSGHVDTEDWETYYKNSDVFICMSEHEGFCVPLVEAMTYQIPIIAYNSSAISETLGQGGILLQKKNFEEFADKINEVITCPKIKERLISNQVRELKRFNKEKISKDLMKFFNQIMEG